MRGVIIRDGVKSMSEVTETTTWVTARLAAGGGFRTDVTVRDFAFVSDEPRDVGGMDSGATPYEYLLGALGACTAMTLRMYAKRKGWALEEVVVRLRDAPTHAIDCANCETQPVGIRRIERQIELRGPMSEEQRGRLLEIAERCPVKQTLERGLIIERAPERAAGAY